MKTNRKSFLLQAGTLKSMFPDSSLHREGEKILIWKCSITPSSLSMTYKVKLKYIRNCIEVYIIDPNPLKLAEGETRLPHVYSHEQQKLCLYYPKNKEWNASMFLTETIIPWTCEWLFHYEIWLGTGEWHGGGIHPDITDNKTDDNN
jgi:hypothetical protein